MNGTPVLSLLIALPALGAVALMFLPRGRGLLAKQVALGISVLTFLMSLGFLLGFDRGGDTYQFTESYEWIPAFGVHWSLGVDGIGLVLVGLTTVLTPIVIGAAWRDVDPGKGNKRTVKGYFALMLLLEAMAIGVFAATDVFVFYVFFEAMLVPMYFLIGSYGGPQRSYAAVKFLLYSLVGGLLMLAAVVGLFVLSSRAGEGTFLLSELQNLEIGTSTQRWLFLGFFVAFAIKAPMWPVHTWLPDAAAQSTPAGAVLLVGILDKVGTFGMIRYCLTLFPDASKYFAPVIVVLAVIGVLYGALVAIGQTDLQRLVAYTSISHFGFITLGIFAMTSTSQTGSTLYMVNHGFSTAALFLVVGFLASRRGSRLVTDFGGVQKVAPVLAGVFLFAGLSALSLPGLSTFVSEFMVLVGSYSRFSVLTILATLGIVLASLYVLLMYQRTMTGPVSASVETMTDLSVREKLVMAPVIAVILALGFFPGVALDVINPAVTATLDHVEVSDPEPAVAGTSGEESE